jgi:two-component system, chemotaxis family, protein-glutamate methylesterase/glutaminase
MRDNGKNRSTESFRPRFPIVCIGLSVGGLEPLKQLFRHVSPATGMAFVVIHHIRSFPTLLPKIISSCTRMPVQVAAPGLVIRPNRVYILPSGKEITAADGYFSMRSRSKQKGWTNVFSVFLESLVKSRHAGIAVVLSGSDANGAAALKDFEGGGGITIVQTPESAELPDMPQAAIDTGHVNYVLPPAQIAAQLEKTAHKLERPRSPS